MVPSKLKTDGGTIPAANPAAAASLPPPADLVSPFRIRRAGEGDRSALIGMLSRCTDRSRLRRFHGIVRTFPEPYFAEALEGSATHFAVVVEAAGDVVALASCRAVGHDAAELAVLVEDAYQRQGLGSDLLRTLVGHAERSGRGTLRATVMADQQWILRALGTYGTCRVVLDFGVFDVTLHRKPLGGGSPQLTSAWSANREMSISAKQPTAAKQRP